MKLFANRSHTRFFANDNHVRGLKTIEVNDVYDLVIKQPIHTVGSLFGKKDMIVDEFGELVMRQVDHEYGNDELFHFDFLSSLSKAEIAQRVLHVHESTDKIAVMRALKTACDATFHHDCNEQKLVAMMADGSVLTATFDLITKVLSTNADISSYHGRKTRINSEGEADFGMDRYAAGALKKLKAVHFNGQKALRAFADNLITDEQKYANSLSRSLEIKETIDQVVCDVLGAAYETNQPIWNDGKVDSAVALENYQNMMASLEATADNDK
jgi:hypothetical protein